MDKRVKVTFNDVSDYQAATASGGLVLAIRRDCHFATKVLKKNIRKSLLSVVFDETQAEASARKTLVDRVVHEAYRAWTNGVLKAVGQCMDYSRHGIHDSSDMLLNVNFYDGDDLACRIVDQAHELVKRSEYGAAGEPAVFISLDERFQGEGDRWQEIAFSRHFSLSGDRHFGYTARPGHQPIEEQIEILRRTLEAMGGSRERRMPLVLLEDNVRHAKMLNWIIDLMDKGGVFEHADIAGISTCFCCASSDEQNLILYKGKPVPVDPVVDFEGRNVDVVTPRDLLFDGYVVQVEDRMTRLPGIFMDVEKLFKVHPDRVSDFHAQVRRANREFCQAIERELGVSLPLSWFATADAIAHVGGHSPETLMRAVMMPDEERIVPFVGKLAYSG